MLFPLILLLRYALPVFTSDFFAILIFLPVKNSLKTLKIRVTDSELITLTGGIIQGLSGSPILQNGKLVGAVTHVLIDNPQMGYGIFAESMLE